MNTKHNSSGNTKEDKKKENETVNSGEDIKDNCSNCESCENCDFMKNSYKCGKLLLMSMW